MRRLNPWLAALSVALCLPLAGCFVLDELTGEPAGSPRLPFDPIDGGGEAPLLPTAQLTVSNPTPTVGETVTLFCNVTNEVPGPFAFTFSPSVGPFVLAQEGNQAVIFVDESALDQSVPFTCTVTNPEGTGPSSQAVVVTVIGMPFEG